ncbi:hydrogen peroxide-inducible genes activator [Silicimonas algicola]|uniref:LysR family transcriptional regulator n=1 Tax=Silicimonas algicola TaxID=1826607 RepID=A0A316GSC4_9RHOB|nr:hydrogen peroxide-inducible genes activator [Silicimonas algicola]AZQ67679.1 hydrogen peroxide-inducible genes activator [Silicimonas algicola]PWK57917.1 LysR family transcriptional regulator [Silicimonas algicola]
MSVTLRQLQYFVALAETLQFGAAAEKVHVSQPALSLQIKAMEEALGARLVDRLPREVRLTRVGQEVLDRARRVLTEVGDLEQSVRWRDGLAGRLRLGVIPTVAPYLLPMALTRLRARDITLDIRIREAQTTTLVTGLRDGRLDAAIMALPLQDPGLTARPLFRDRFLLCGSPARLDSLGQGAEGLRPQAIAQDQLLLLDEGHCLADQALEVCGLRSRPNVDLGASSLATLAGLVAQGFGLTFLPELAVATELRAQPDLALRRFDAPEPGRDLALVTRSAAEGAGWVDTLAGILIDAGGAALALARDATLRKP